MKFIFASISFLILTSNVFGQENKSIKDDLFYLNNGIQGVANYEFAVNKKDTVKNGKFHFHQYEEVVEKKMYEAINIEGNYKNNLKDGKWVYTFKTLELAENYTLKEYFIKKFTNGVEKKITANYSNRIPTGKQTSVTNQIENSNIADTLEFTEINYDKGKVIGAFISFNNQYQLSGFVNNSGLADKTWEIIHKNEDENDVLVEHRVYSNGIIIKHYLIQNNDTIDRNIGLGLNNNDGDIWEEIEMNRKYTKLLDFTNIKYKENITNEIQELIDSSNLFLLNKINLNYYYKNINIENLLEGSVQIDGVINFT